MTHRRFVTLTVAPAMILLIALALVSIVGAVWLSLMDMSLRYPESEFAGLFNYERLMRDRRFINALWVSLEWQLITVTGTLLLAILLSVMIVETVKSRFWRNVICFAFLVPVLLPRVAAAFVWRYIYSPSIGILNWFLGLFGIGPVEFLADPDIALLAVAAVDIWQWGLFFTVILVKLLETIPREPVEAALLDRARTWQIHAYITLPMLKGPIISLAFVKAVESLRSFDLIYVMTGGGPGTTTETLDLYAYQQGINLGGRVSYAAAMSILLLIATVIAFTVIWRVVRRWAD